MAPHPTSADLTRWLAAQMALLTTLLGERAEKWVDITDQGPRDRAGRVVRDQRLADLVAIGRSVAAVKAGATVGVAQGIEGTGVPQ